MSTLTVYGSSTDADIYVYDASYSNARAGTGSAGSPVTSAETCNVGQQLQSGPFYFCTQGMVQFDTSALGAGATISAAVLSMLVTDQTETGTDFDVEARVYDWGGTVTTADFVPGASLAGLTLAAHWNTAGSSEPVRYDFTDDALAANINKTGYTRFVLASARQRTNTAPTADDENVKFAGGQAVTQADRPKLIITYTAAGGAPTWVSPADGAALTSTPVLVFASPVSASPQHFNLQLDTSSAFNTGNLRDLITSTSQTGWEYDDTGSGGWTAFPSGGLAAAKSGNQVRHTVQSALSSTTWYRRVRAGT